MADRASCTAQAGAARWRAPLRGALRHATLRSTRWIVPVVGGGLVALAGCTSISLTSAPAPAAPAVGAGSTDGAATGAAAAPRVQPPSLGFFSSIKVPDDVEPVLRLQARGVQIFRCESRPRGYQWVYRQPEAELRDPAAPDAPVVARHGVNYSFEHNDGSRLIAQILKFDSAARTDALPWLLMSARSFGNGAFAGITLVQRVNTAGGMPPAGCDAQQVDRPLRVDFSADFVFYRLRPTAP